jgi:hypothetical protein
MLYYKGINACKAFVTGFAKLYKTLEDGLSKVLKPFFKPLRIYKH